MKASERPRRLAVALAILFIVPAVVLAAVHRPAPVALGSVYWAVGQLVRVMLTGDSKPPG